MRRVIFLFICILLMGVGDKTIITKASTYNGNSLDTGIYWFGKNGAKEKYVEGKRNRFFDSSKPTVIYVHGWQPNSTQVLDREDFRIGNTSKRSSDYWVDKGWNIGIFYWDQFADEAEVKDAEAKIWSDESSKSLRWRTVDGKYNFYYGTERSVSEIFVNQYIKCMKDFTGGEVRLVGHSLGNQFVINSSKILYDKIFRNEIKSNLGPRRVALLDPFWSKFSKEYLDGKWTGGECRDYVSYLKTRGVIFEQYKSSDINDLFIGDSNDDMRKLTAFTEIYPDYIQITDQSSKHKCIVPWYFQSFGYDAPSEFIGGRITGKKACSASTLTTRLKEMMGSCWWQKDGKDTETPLDDTFELAVW